MTDYFSDREYGPRPKVREDINKNVWDAIESLIDNRINDGSLAKAFPGEPCLDGNAIVSTDQAALWNRVRGDIRGIFDEHYDSFALPDTPMILDFVEFIARHVEEPIRLDWHGPLKHHHLEFDRVEGLRKFVEDVNRIFSRNGLAYELTESGTVKRTIPVPIADMMKRTHFRTGDDHLDDLLETAIDRFLSPKPEARQDALEKLWDAFERLKTIEAGKDKRIQAGALIDRAISGDAPVFRVIVEEDFRALTDAGNKLRIRHSEIGKEPVGDGGEKDYLFSRMYSLLWLVLKATGRMS